MVASASSARPAASWRDDFDELDTRTWRTVSWGCFDPDNATVLRGHLRMRITPSSDPACPAIGARINTYGLKGFGPGTFSARIKFVTAPGSWQTFWLTGAGGEPFPGNGEVDIAEIIGRMPDNTHVALHSTFLSGGSKRCDQGSSPPARVDRVWHVYSATTSRSRVTFRIDGKVIGVYEPNDRCTWPFGDRMRLLFSARGGHYGGEVDASAYPVTYLVDWVSWQAR